MEPLRAEAASTNPLLPPRGRSRLAEPIVASLASVAPLLLGVRIVLVGPCRGGERAEYLLDVVIEQPVVLHRWLFGLAVPPCTTTRARLCFPHQLYLLSCIRDATQRPMLEQDSIRPDNPATQAQRTTSYEPPAEAIKYAYKKERSPPSLVRHKSST